MRNHYHSPEFLLHKLVIELDKIADEILHKECNLSYKRYYFLLTLQYNGELTQHQLARALGYSDPAVSTMLQILAKEKYVVITPSQDHRRKRLVTLSAKGEKTTRRASNVLHNYFNSFMKKSGVDTRHYAALTSQLLSTIERSRNDTLAKNTAPPAGLRILSRFRRG